MILEAFAKINWSLDITGIREDGYHYMDMLMQPVSLSDEIHLSRAASLNISASGNPAVRPDEKNLAWRAASALKTETSCPGGADIHVLKRIPVGAGMGGGSTDAAAVLVGLNILWNLNLPASELERIGLKLGADVPFFIRGGLTRTRGIGEALESHDYMSCFWLVVIQPCSGLSTAQVFSRWHEGDVRDRPNTDAALRALEAADLTLLCGSIGNVLQPVSAQLRPEIDKACTSLLEQGACTAKMTGSGSAVFGVFRTRRQAETAFRKLSASFRTIFLCHTQHDSIRIREE